ncbi:MAG TPA: ribonuclease HI family protein [bacterium]|nr:ribonuclease HI family protein [bacterium]
MKSITLHFDGTSKPNPGKSACAFILLDENGDKISSQTQYLGEGTNNIAEYFGLILGLIAALKYRPDRILIYADSNLIIQQLKGTYRVKDTQLQKLYLIATEILKLFPAVDINYLQHEKNPAHSLAKSSIENDLFD